VSVVQAVWDCEAFRGARMMQTALGRIAWLREQPRAQKQRYDTEIATTAATREYTWSTHVEPRWASVLAANVHTTDIRSWVQDMTAAGAGPTTVENAVSVLRLILEMAVQDRRLPRNPSQGVKTPKRKHRSRGSPDPRAGTTRADGR
jgi:site-specific recombinase XerC